MNDANRIEGMNSLEFRVNSCRLSIFCWKVFTKDNYSLSLEYHVNSCRVSVTHDDFISPTAYRSDKLNFKRTSDTEY